VNVLRKYPPPKGRTWRGQSNAGSTRAWRDQRARILERDNWRCTYVDLATGERCPTAHPHRLEVHHLTDGYGPTAVDHELATRCPTHNRGRFT
jgi:hypothetical protein